MEIIKNNKVIVRKEDASKKVFKGVSLDSLEPVIASSVAVMWGMDHFGWMKALSVLLVFTGVLLVTGTGGKRTVQEQ